MNPIDKKIKEMGYSGRSFCKHFGCSFKTISSLREGKAQIDSYVRYASIAGEDPLMLMAITTGAISSSDAYVPSSNPHVTDRNFIESGLGKTTGERTNALIKSGFSRDIYHDWVGLLSVPKPSSLVHLAQALNADPIDLLTWGYTLYKERLANPPKKRDKIEKKEAAETKEQKKPAKAEDIIKQKLQSVNPEEAGFSESEFQAIIARVTVPRTAAVKRIAGMIDVPPVELWQWMAQQDEPDDESVLSDVALANPLRTRLRNACGARSVEWFCERYRVPKRILADALGRADIPTVYLIRLANGVGVSPASLWRWIARL